MMDLGLFSGSKLRTKLDTIIMMIMESSKQPFIEITEEKKNIIRYCVEESYYRDIESGEHETRAEITKSILDKLVAIKKKEDAAGTFGGSYFF